MPPPSTSGGTPASPIPARLDHPDGPAQGHRPHPAPGAVRGEGRIVRRLRADPTVDEPDSSTGEIPDDRLRLIFTCCHPALALEAQVALTLRTLGGLETDEIARAFLVPVGDDGAAAGAREAQDPRRRHSLHRARHERHARAPRRGADGDLSRLQRRLRGDARRAAGADRSLRRGHPAGPAGQAADGAAAAARSDRLSSPSCCFTIRGAMPGSTRPATSSLLEEQDRAPLGSGRRSPRRCRSSRRRCAADPARSRCRRRSPPCTARRRGPKTPTGPRSSALYDLLERLQPSPIVSLNRAVAVAMVDGPRPALALIDALAADGDLDGYHLLHAARADLLRRARIHRRKRRRATRGRSSWSPTTASADSSSGGCARSRPRGRAGQAPPARLGAASGTVALRGGRNVNAIGHRAEADGRRADEQPGVAAEAVVQPAAGHRPERHAQGGHASPPRRRWRP